METSGYLLLLGGLPRLPTFGGLPLVPVLLLTLPVLRVADLGEVSSAHQLLLVVIAALRQLHATLAGGVDRVQERGAHARFLQDADGRYGGAAWRRHHLAELHGMLAGVAQHLRRVAHRLGALLGLRG